ncbi:MAG: ATP-binding protein [Treponema sp.]|nr:ATP-binding protein [Treponema sp.]
MILRKIIPAIIISVLFLGCGKSTNNAQDNVLKTFYDIPGITKDEIKVIEALRGRTLIYGMPLSVEAFEDEKGDVKGFSALFCEWMSGIFGITFKPAIYDWLDILAGLETRDISFTGEITPTAERLLNYYMSKPIASRLLNTYRLAGSKPLEEIVSERRIRCGFIEGTTTVDTVTYELKAGTYDIVLLKDVDLVYDALKNGVIDVFYYSQTAEANFLHHRDLSISHFYPLTYRPVSMTTQNPSLEPIITVLDKIIANHGLRIINEFYIRGELEFKKYKLFSWLNDKQKEYLAKNKEVRFVAEYYNYPVSFYNSYEREWQGIIFDMIPKIERLTGLTFTLVNEKDTEWPELVRKLEEGEAQMSAEMIRSHDREGRFLWPNQPTLIDYYTLVSKYTLPNISINEIMDVRIGLVWGSVYSEIFKRWFPGHQHIVEYISSNAAFNGLERGEVDMVMSSQHRLLAITNYNEFVGYKANIIFDYKSESRFAFNINESILCSIIDTALEMLDSKAVADQWMRRTYDYRSKVAKAQRPWLIGSSILLLSVVFLLFILIIRTRKEGIMLESLVRERTEKLNKYQNELEAALNTAKAASKSKSSFLANMSHEIRTPMNSIIGFSELAIDDAVSKKTKDYLNSIKTNAEWLLQIINDILDISKIESGKMELEKIPFDMHDLFSSCRTLVMPKAVEKGIMLHFYAEPSVGRKPLGDPTRLRQVFINLLSNAVKFTNTGIVKLVTDVVTVSGNTITFHFEVKDSGIGMTAKQIDTVFEPFAQGESGTTRKYGGTGLGLPITKSIIEMMGGKLLVESTPGIGSRFYFDLTFDTVDVTKEEFFEKKVSLKEIEKPVFEGEVLLCEDNIMNQQVICEHLSRVGLKTSVAENGKIGLDMVTDRLQKHERQFDLIFMDMHMPVMDGLEASTQIIKLATGVPIIAMTANIMADDREVYKRSGLNDCVGKPFTSQELWRCLLKYLKPLSGGTMLDKIDSPEADMEFQNSLKKYFIKANSNCYEDMCRALDQDDKKTAHRIVHSLKSNAGQIKKIRLQTIAADLEFQLMGENNTITPVQLAEFKMELDSVLAELKAMFAESE